MATLKYLDKAYQFLRYFGKIDRGVYSAHLKCLLPTGNDYRALSQGAEMVPWTDAEFDEAKVRALFLERFGITDSEFTFALSLARSRNLIHPTKLIPTQTLSDLVWSVEDDQKVRRSAILGSKDVTWTLTDSEKQQLADLRNITYNY